MDFITKGNLPSDNRHNSLLSTALLPSAPQELVEAICAENKLGQLWALQHEPAAEQPSEVEESKYVVWQARAGSPKNLGIALEPRSRAAVHGTKRTITFMEGSKIERVKLAYL